MTGNPILDNRRKLGTIFAVPSPQKASPNRRRSAITIIPTDNGSAKIWLPSIRGKSHSDSVIAVAKRVCCSHWHHSKRGIVNFLLTFGDHNREWLKAEIACPGEWADFPVCLR